MRFKVQEPVLLLGQQRFQNVDIRLRVKGGGHVSQVYGKACKPEERVSQPMSAHAPLSSMPGAYSALFLGWPQPLSRLVCPAAIRQAIAKGLVAFYQKCTPSLQSA